MFIGIQLKFLKVFFNYYLIIFVTILCQMLVSLGPLGTPSTISWKVIFLVCIFCHTILWSGTLWRNVCLIKFLLKNNNSTWLKIILSPLLIWAHPLSQYLVCWPLAFKTAAILLGYLLINFLQYWGLNLSDLPSSGGQSSPWIPQHAFEGWWFSPKSLGLILRETWHIC